MLKYQQLASEPTDYLSAKMWELVDGEKARGRDVIDFSIGNPDLPPPQFVIDALLQQVQNNDNHRYPPYESQGVSALRQAVAAMYRRRFNVTLDYSKEVLILMGAKESAHYLCMTLIKPGDVVIVCEPAYTTYKENAKLFGAEVVCIQCRKEHAYLPDLSDISPALLARTKLMFINYPNNPTGAVASLELFAELIALARQHDFIVCNDNVYSELYYDAPPPSLLEIPGALDVAVEVNSISKSYNLCGWRIGMMLGNATVLGKVLHAKRYSDAGPSAALQHAAVFALDHEGGFHVNLRAEYLVRRDLLVAGLGAAGYRVFHPQAGMFVWAQTPGRQAAALHVAELLERHGIACNPGNAYGKVSAEYVRFSLSVSSDRIGEAMSRLSSF